MVRLVYSSFNLSTQMDLCELKASLWYRMSSRKARARQRDLVSKVA